MSEETKKKKRPKLSVVWQEAKILLWEHRRRLALGLLLLIISRLSTMVLPASSKWLIDEVITKGNYSMLGWIAAAAGVSTLVSAATGFGLSMILGVAGQRAINDLRITVQGHVGKLPVGFFDEHKSGEMVSRIMTDAEGIRNLVGTGFVQMVGGLVTASVAVTVLFWLNWRLTSLTLVLLLIFASCMAYGFGRLRPIFRERSRIRADLTGRLVEGINGIRVVKAYTAEAREEQTFISGSKALLDNVVKTMVGVSAITSISTLLFGLMGLGMGVIGTREVIAGRMTMGDLFMYLLFTGLMVTPLIQIGAIGTQITEAFAGLDRIREIFSELKEPFDDPLRTPLGRVRGDVVFEDVWFEYRPDLPVLKGVSFTAPAGTTTALVGPSGSGKSTLIGLVMAFHEPMSGTISVDGRPLDKVRLEDYRAQLGIVLQDNFLFAGTIQENIGYSRPGASQEDIVAAAKIAHCHEFIEGFPDAYETVVGERGIRLSGGQRQRIAIARAVLADPRLLILDEATSSLDSESEAQIQAGLKALLEGRTTLVIAHRLSTIRDADQILVLEHGEIVERGSHAQLISKGGRYKSLYDKQYQIELNRFINPGEDFTALPEAEPLAAADTSPNLRRLD